MSESHHYEQDCLNELNHILTKLNHSTYNNIKEVNIKDLQLFRSEQSYNMNSNFTQRDAMIAGYCGNVWLKTIYNGLYYNLYYNILKVAYTKKLEPQQQKYFDDYSPLIRIGLFGVSYGLSCLSKIVLQFIIKHGVKITDKFLDYFCEHDSPNKQFIGGIIMAFVAFNFSFTGGFFISTYDGYRCYKGYRENSDYFQKNLKDLQSSINKIQKFQ